MLLFGTMLSDLNNENNPMKVFHVHYFYFDIYHWVYFVCHALYGAHSYQGMIIIWLRENNHDYMYLVRLSLVNYSSYTIPTTLSYKCFMLDFKLFE